VLTENNAALNMLFDFQILTHGKTEVIFGSKFALDQTDLQICLNIQKIKLCMAEGVNVILVNCESLYESLYDLLNQHYSDYAGQRYVRLAFGSHSKLCPIHPAFRVVVVVEKFDAYNKLAPPLLNRFEKQLLVRENLLTDAHHKVVERLAQFAAAVFGGGNANASANYSASVTDLRRAFCGYHAGLLSSLVLSLVNRNAHNPLSESALFAEAVRLLLWIAMPETICRAMGSDAVKGFESQLGFSVSDVYFRKQTHGDLATLVRAIVGNGTSGNTGGNAGGSAAAAPAASAAAAAAASAATDAGAGSLAPSSVANLTSAPPQYSADDSSSSSPSPLSSSSSTEWGDPLGVQLCVTTFSPINRSVAKLIQDSCAVPVSHVILHELSSERELSRVVKEFFESASSDTLLLVQCGNLSSSSSSSLHSPSFPLFLLYAYIDI
jgi:hypothetical protein